MEVTAPEEAWAQRRTPDLVRDVLAYLRGVTGLDAVQLLQVDQNQGSVRVTLTEDPGCRFSPEGAVVPWRDSPSRRAEETGIWRTNRLARDWPGWRSDATLQSFAGVASRDARGRLIGAVTGLSSSPVYVDDGAYRAIEVTAELAISLHRGADEARRSLDFLDLTAHELRRPVALASGYLSIFEEADLSALPETLRQAVGRAARQLELARGILTNVLEAARLETRGLRLNRQVVDLRSLADEAVTQVDHGHLPAHRLFARLGDHALPVLADAFYLRTVLINLIDNAVKYSPAGGEVRITAGAGASMTGWVSVSDEGVGIAPEDQARLFEPFERAERVAGQGIPGTGLGLYLANRIARAHGGQISVASPGMGSGSVFTLRVPLAAGA
jgi:signal transduction histidine kinase